MLNLCNKSTQLHVQLCIIRICFHISRNGLLIKFSIKHKVEFFFHATHFCFSFEKEFHFILIALFVGISLLFSFLFRVQTCAISCFIKYSFKKGKKENSWKIQNRKSFVNLSLMVMHNENGQPVLVRTKEKQQIVGKWRLHNCGTSAED